MSVISSRMKTISSATAVIARNSSFTFKGKAVDVKEVGRRLGVRYVLEGSVRKAAGKVRITGQLIDAITGAHICLLRSHENKLFARTQLLLGVGESRFEHFANRLPRAAVELN
jgi:hypothetical protein